MRLIALVSLALLAAPALAQQPQSALEAASEPAAKACSEARNDTDLVRGAAICVASAATIREALAANPQASQHALNMAYAYLGHAEFSIAGNYVKIDKVRSARGCQHVEAAWAAHAKIDPSASPHTYEEGFKAMRESVVGSLKLCRSEFGTPAGAPAAP